MLQILHQFDGPVARTDYAQMEGDAALLVADRFKIGGLYSAGKHHFQVLHGQRPTEGFLIEELIQRANLGQQLHIGGLAHHLLL